jgi:O-antigen ligase
MASNEAPIRVTGIFDNINIAGGTLAISFLLTVSLYFRNEGSILRKKILPSLILLFLVPALVFTNSRASLLAASLGFVVLILTLYPKYRVKFISSIFIMIAIFILIPQIGEFFTYFLRFEKFLNIRDHLWAMSWETIKENPIFGSGPDQFKEYFFKYNTTPEGSYANYMIKKLYVEAGDSGLSHNFILFRITELGIPGLVTAFWLPGMFIIYAVKTLGKIKEIDKNGFLLTAVSLSIGIGLFARSFFESIGILTYGWIMVDLPFWICFMVILFYYHSAFQIQKETL